jgi:hypothetical protein
MAKLKTMVVIPGFSDFGKLMSQLGKISVKMLA